MIDTELDALIARILRFEASTQEAADALTDLRRKATVCYSQHLEQQIEQLERDLAEAKKDAARLDWIELTIRDGSYRSILNDMTAVCEHAYANIGPGPALRSTIDSLMPAIASAGKGKPNT